MVGWHHRLKGLEFEQTLGDSEGPDSLVSCSLWGLKRVEWDLVTRHNKKRFSWFTIGNF